MRINHRQRLSIAAVLLLTAASVFYLTFAMTTAGPDGQTIDLAVVDDEQTIAYRLIPDSVMTGLCWHSGNGYREGIFKDVNAGLAHWRDHAPEAVNPVIQDSGDSDVSVTEQYTGSALLSRQLDQLSFEATAYSFTNKSAELTGELTIGDHRRKLVLTMNMSATQDSSPGRNLLELTAFTLLPLEDLQNAQSDTVDRPLNLCITMQAAKDTVLPDSNSGKPMLLSHYY